MCHFGHVMQLDLVIGNHFQISFIIGTLRNGIFSSRHLPYRNEIVADYYEKGLGKALGLLVGALVFGKAFPYLVKSLGFGNNFGSVIISTSVVCAFGGFLLWALVPDGPFRKPSKS